MVEEQLQCVRVEQQLRVCVVVASLHRASDPPTLRHATPTHQSCIAGVAIARRTLVKLPFGCDAVATPIEEPAEESSWPNPQYTTTTVPSAAIAAPGVCAPP